MTLEIEQYYEILRKSKLFYDLDLEATLHIVNCLKGYTRIYKSGSVVLPYGSKTEYAGEVTKLKNLLDYEKGSIANVDLIGQDNLKL